MRVILALTLPAATLLAIGIRPAVEILGFDAAGTDVVVWTTRAFLVGLMGQALIEVASRAFYAQQNARIPLLASAFTVTTFIILGFFFYRPLGAAGIALANSLAFSGEAVLLWLLLNRRFEGLLEVGSTLGRAVPISIGSALAVFALMRLPLPDLPLAAVALSLGALAVLPFIWPEVKMLVKL
jgi:putative peptidoglycan lipid II flippase